jgi:hypothetical protein
MVPFTRNPVPRRLSWDLTDGVITHFFWLAVAAPGKGQSLQASVQDNVVEITTTQVKEFDLYLDSRLVSLAKPLRVSVDGKSQTVDASPQMRTLCATMRERGDPQLASSCRLRLSAQIK